MVSGLADIAYNLIVSPQGDMFFGRGDQEDGQHTFGWDHSAISVAVIGKYDTKAPSDAAITTLRNLIQCGVNIVSRKINCQKFSVRLMSAAFLIFVLMCTARIVLNHCIVHFIA